jgi:hypothetical protein
MPKEQRIEQAYFFGYMIHKFVSLFILSFIVALSLIIIKDVIIMNIIFNGD